jgi:selenocysteine-specific elongation factor
MPKEELKSKLKVTARLYAGLIDKLIQENQIQEEGPIIRLTSHGIIFSPQQEEKLNKLLHQFSSSPYSPPSIKESKTFVGEDVYQAMVDLELLVPVSPEVVFKKQDYDQMVGEIKTLLAKEETISAAQVRDHFNTSRRYALALLEHLDEIGLTIRTGDVRRLK